MEGGKEGREGGKGGGKREGKERGRKGREEGRRGEEGGGRREEKEEGRRGEEGAGREEGRGKKGSVCDGGVWTRYLDSLEPSLHCFTEEISESTEPERREREKGMREKVREKRVS